jgi:hypothetical protein
MKLIPAAALVLLTTLPAAAAQQRPGPGEPIRPSGGTCPAGTHLVHISGERGIVDPDTREYDDAEYTCEPDQAVEDARCLTGRAVLVDGLAACACAAGYAGAHCETCAPGYERGRRGACEPSPMRATPIIEGAEQSIEQGQELTLRAHMRGAREFRWRIVEGDGCLVDPRTSRCGRTAGGPQVRFRAPRSGGDDVAMTQVDVLAIGTPGLPPAPGSTSVTWVPPGHITISGTGAAYLQPILSAFSRFMRFRCVGGGMIGVSRYGQPIGAWGLGRMHGRATLDEYPGCGDSAIDPYDPASSNVQADTPFRIGSISKSVTAAITRWVLKDTWKALDPSADPTDSGIEALHVFAANAYPTTLFPGALFDLYAGNTPVPVVISDELTTHADPRWTDVTVGHFLAHRSGLPRSAPHYANVVTPSLGVLRGLSSEAAVQAQEQILIDEVGALTVGFAKIMLGVPDAYVLPRARLAETLAVVAGRVLANDPGVSEYSNTSPAYLTTIGEHLTGQPFAGRNGYPATHDDSLLKAFFAQVLNEPSTASSGIFATQSAVGVAGYVSPESEKRSWSASQQTYYPVFWDEKRPHCVWDGGGCDFTSWRTASSGRINWAWTPAQVHFAYDGSGESPGTGSLVTRARTFLTFMANFWVKGYQVNPKIGEARNNVWNAYTRHNGAGAGMLAWAMQLGSNGPTSWALPPLDGQGRITDDFANLTTYACALPTGQATTLPPGVDIIVAINTYGSDKRCAEDPGYECDTAYGLLDNFILQGVCRVVWP